MGPWRVEQRRGAALEAEHRVHACAVDASGALVWQVGEDRVTTLRSAAKPFQLQVCLSLLPAARRDTLTSAELALGSASHHGEPAHVAAVTQLMDKLAVRPEQLQCGTHEPLSSDSTRQLYARGELPDVRHNNCSGKHTFMAAACAARGYPADYRDISHPLQRETAQYMAEQAGVAHVDTVVDGCGVPCFVLPLSAMARSYAQLASALVQPARSGLGRVGAALLQHPILMSGHTAFDGWLIRTAQVVAKVGAQGLLCIALPAQGLGLAIKIESGFDAARPVAVAALLEHFVPGLLSEPLPEALWVVRNARGDQVGALGCRP